MCNEYSVYVYDGNDKCIIANYIYAYNKADAVMKFLSENSQCWFDLDKIVVKCVASQKYDI